MNLPSQLKQEVEKWATIQGILPEQFILWAVAEKIGALNQQLDASAFPDITIRRGGSSIPSPILRATGIRVQTIVIAMPQWGLSVGEIAAEYGLTEAQVNHALAFYEAHTAEIDAAIIAEQQIEAADLVGQVQWLNNWQEKL